MGETGRLRREGPEDAQEGVVTEADQEEYLRRKVKAELRKRMRALRNAAPLTACEERSAKIRAFLLQLPEVQKATAIALFWPIEGRNEVDLRPLDAELRARNVGLAYPAIDPETRKMTFRFVAHPDEMEERGYGFFEPGIEAREADKLDVVVVPALAIDPRGHRIGYGAGYYDRALPLVSPPAHLVAVAFDYQRIAEVPVTPGDIAVHQLVTDARVAVSERD